MDAALTHSSSHSAVRVVHSDGFSRTALPASMAQNASPKGMRNGIFHGAMTPTTPRGRRRTEARLLAKNHGVQAGSALAEKALGVGGEVGHPGQALAEPNSTSSALGGRLARLLSDHGDRLVRGARYDRAPRPRSAPRRALGQRSRGAPDLRGAARGRASRGLRRRRKSHDGPQTLAHRAAPRGAARSTPSAGPRTGRPRRSTSRARAPRPHGAYSRSPAPPVAPRDQVRDAQAVPELAGRGRLRRRRRARRRGRSAAGATKPRPTRAGRGKARARRQKLNPVPRGAPRGSSSRLGLPLRRHVQVRRTLAPAAGRGQVLDDRGAASRRRGARSYSRRRPASSGQVVRPDHFPPFLKNEPSADSAAEAAAPTHDRWPCRRCSRPRPAPRP